MTAATDLVADTVNTPLGPLVLVSDGEALVMLEWEDQQARWQRYLQRHFGVKGGVKGGVKEGVNERVDGTDRLARAKDPGGLSSAVAAWFGGDLSALDRIALRPVGTPFQQRVWAHLCTIPAGTTTTYASLAESAGLTRNASRAAGAANGANPICVVIPCHRVLGSDGRPTGYSGGIDRKLWLLRHEGAPLRSTRELRSIEKRRSSG